VLSKVLTVKAAALALVVLAGGTAAAATGSLPDPAQAIVSHALSHLAISVPNPQANRHATGRDTADAGSPTRGPDAAGPAKHGLCTASTARLAPTIPHDRERDSVAFTNLQAAAQAAHQSVADFCKDVTPVRDAATTTVAPDRPPASTPNRGTGTPSTTRMQTPQTADHGKANPNTERTETPITANHGNGKPGTKRTQTPATAYHGNSDNHARS